MFIGVMGSAPGFPLQLAGSYSEWVGNKFICTSLLGRGKCLLPVNLEVTLKGR